MNPGAFPSPKCTHHRAYSLFDSSLCSGATQEAGSEREKVFSLRFAHAQFPSRQACSVHGCPPHVCLFSHHSSAAQPHPVYKVGHLHTGSAQNCEITSSSASQHITTHFHNPHLFDSHLLIAMSSFTNETFSFSTLPPISSMMSQAPLPAPHNGFIFGQYPMQQHAFRVHNLCFLCSCSILTVSSLIYPSNQL
jgi:hypothetical protein